MKKTLFDLLPPTGVVIVVLFWAYAPQALLDNPWTFVVSGALIIAVVQLLEFVHERHTGWRIDRREFATDLAYVVFGNTVIAWATVALAETPLKAAKQSLGITTEWAMQMPFVAQVALVIVVWEFGQYWMHRLMHNNAFFWSTHAPHHHLTQLNAMKGWVGNPIELFLISLSVVALLDVPSAAFLCALNVLGVVSTFAHANVKADPPIWYSYVFTTIRNHSLHHTALSYEDTRCNYGNSLILLDRIFGTYREGESEVVGQGERKRLTITEQTFFPVLPLIDRLKLRRSPGSTVANES
jgi:sterol desaturase/sphingolipid hydroxylase (fatty acid hydroxylase superfamily)